MILIEWESIYTKKEIEHFIYLYNRREAIWQKIDRVTKLVLGEASHVKI